MHQYAHATWRRTMRQSRRSFLYSSPSFSTSIHCRHCRQPTGPLAHQGCGEDAAILYQWRTMCCTRRHARVLFSSGRPTIILQADVYRLCRKRDSARPQAGTAGLMLPTTAACVCVCGGGEGGRERRGGSCACACVSILYMVCLYNIYIYILYVYMFICLYIYMCLYVYMCLYASMFICLYVCVHRATLILTTTLV